jgi:uroporphyrinogen decarboxylase
MAVAHQEPDRLPVDLGATIVTTIVRIAYQNLRQYLGMGLDPQPIISHRQMDTVYPMEDFFRRFDVDFRAVHMKSAWEFKPREMPDDSFYDEFNVRWRKASYYYDAVERPLGSAQSIHDLEAFPWPDPYDVGRVAGIRDEAKALYENTDYAIIADIMCGGPFEQACVLRGYDQFLVDLCWDVPFAEYLLDKITELDVALWQVYLREVGDYIQIAAQGDDVGMQTGTYTSPAMYRQFVKPRQKKLFDAVHAHSNARVFYHSCGSVYDLIGDFIDIGVDILNPVQRGAAKMDIATLKREFGQDITFFGGGVDVQKTLPFGTLDDIRDEVRRTIEIMAPGGGFVFVPSHNIQADIAPERVMAVYDTVREYWHYPVRG